VSPSSADSRNQLLTIAQGKGPMFTRSVALGTGNADPAIQFHVDKLSSAHIYLRMSDGQTWDNLPESLVTDLAQLTKANSIEGA
jgi:hypothetical protein